MMLTEDDARTKWCPFVRHEGDIGGTWNRGIRDNPTNSGRELLCSCIASGCMAWDWDCPDGYIREGDKFHALSDEDAPEYLEAVGYCGLAGKP